MECRKQVFLQVRVSHEPLIWQTNLSPTDLVKEILEAAVKAIQSLRQKRDMSVRRSADQAFRATAGPRPSKKARRRLAMLRHRQQHSQQQLAPIAIPVQQGAPTTSGRGCQQQQLYTIL